MYESRPGIELYYFYDSYGNLTSIRYIKAGETTAYSYYVTTNAQGDVLGIYTAAGVQVAAYEYDAWGNCTVYDVTQDSAGNNVFTEVTYSDSQKFNMEFLNPFRYRGYYYDQDMGLYYLQSRYYDPQIGRFINADSESLVVSKPLDLTDKNLFAYCDNNPVVRVDNGGNFWNAVIGAASGTIVGGITAAISEENVGAGILSGALSGFVAGGILDLTIATGGTGLIAFGAVVLGSGASNFAGSALNQTLNGKTIDWGTAAIDGLWGAVGGALSFGLADVGGATSKTLKQIFSQSGQKIAKDIGEDLLMDITISGSTWINGSKMNLLKDGGSNKTISKRDRALYLYSQQTVEQRRRR